MQIVQNEHQRFSLRPDEEEIGERPEEPQALLLRFPRETGHLRLWEPATEVRGQLG
jgi:hypothetical protein